VTFFGLLLTPVFYVVIRKFTERKKEKPINFDSKEDKNDKGI